ncbi:MAG TPA: zf-HC2 domain-containing protein [Casimicrobiaceae bacterium]|nr:zf-HC2 domain-containing protein [Casimicrobiaceae bacterium]
MNCHEATTIIAAVADGEADRRMRQALADHVRDCPDCASAQQALADLRARVRAELPYHAAPPALRARVLDAVRQQAPAAAPRGWRWFGAGGLAGAVAAALAFVVVNAVLTARARDDVIAAAVTAHVHATTANQLIAVASSDQHTVKPWLSARLDYSPPVPRAEGSGFTLVGGRLDQLDGHPVATLVYRYRDHVVDAFVQPAGTHPQPAGVRTIRGFHVVPASDGAMDWLVVSDVSADVLQAFARTLAAPEPAR